MKKQKESGTSIFLGCKTFKKIPFLVIYDLGNFDNLIQSGFWIITKITFANLCKPVHDIISIPVSSLLFESGNVERKGKFFENLNTSRAKRAF